MGPKSWKQVTAETKNKKYINGFKREIKNINPLNVHVEFVRPL